MDYEEKYKEALERARQFFEKPYLEDSAGIVGYIFPELKESEDEQHRKWILEYLYDGLRNSDEQFKDHFKAAIAWFEKQGKLKPAEWSEEDERIKNNLLSELTNLSVRKLIKKETKKKYASWLKSLRPQSRWKPSDEQMNGLEDTIKFLGCTKTRREQLQSLYQDLKKLGGGKL